MLTIELINKYNSMKCNCGEKATKTINRIARCDNCSTKYLKSKEAKSYLIASINLT